MIHSIKNAKKGQRVFTKRNHKIVGIALEDIDERDAVVYDEEVLYPMNIGGFLRFLPGVRKYK